MIQEFVDLFMLRKNELVEKYKCNLPSSYAQLVTDVVTILNDTDEYGSPDPSRITCINHGNYQGTLVFIIGASGYQPSTYWYVRVYYGSCSGCDAFQRIRDMQYTDDTGDYVPDIEKQIEGYMSLCLQIIQRMKQMDEDALF